MRSVLENANQYIWEYYKLHVEHREKLFNWMLVFASAIFVAYTSLFKNHPLIATAAAYTGAICISCFWIVNQNTLQKIINAKEQLPKLPVKWRKTLNCEARLIGLSDPKIKGLIHFLLIITLLVAGYVALRQNQINKGLTPNVKDQEREAKVKAQIMGKELELLNLKISMMNEGKHKGDFKNERIQNSLDNEKAKRPSKQEKQKPAKKVTTYGKTGIGEQDEDGG